MASSRVERPVKRARRAALRQLTGVAVALALALSARAAGAAEPPARLGTVRGTVRDRDTHQPVAQATVAIEGLALGAASDDAGRFVIRDVPAGSHRVRAWRLDYPAVVVSDAVVTPGRDCEVLVELTALAVKQSGVEVRASGFAHPRDQATSSYQMSYEEIRRSPGAIGDVFRLVQSLPGVVNANDQRNDVIARGGSPVENLVLLDGVEVPNLNHFAAQATTGGPISMLHNELVRDASFLAGGFPAPYGGRLSSVMDIRLRDGDRSRFQSSTDVNLAGLGQLFEGPLARRGAWLVSLRTSYYDLVAKPFGITAVPHASSGQAKLTWDASPHDKLELVNVSGWDHIKTKIHPEDLDDPTAQEYSSGGWRTTTGASWQRLFGSRAWGTLTVSDSYGTFDTDLYDPYYTPDPGARVYHNASSEGETVVRYELAGRAGAWGDWKAGTSAHRERGHFALAQPYGTQNPFSTDTARVDAISLEQNDAALRYGAYAQWTHALVRLADLTLGVRGDRDELLNANTLDPRAGLVTHVAPALDLDVSYGLYHQSPALVFVRAYPQNADLSPIRCEHLTAGLAWTPAPDFKLSLEGYRKNYQDYPVAAEYPSYSLANTGDLYALTGLLLPLVSAGRGHAQGVELFAQKKLTQGFYGQLAWSVSRSENAGLDGVLRRGAYDVPTTATAIVGYKRGAAWEFSTRTSVASGRPYTPPLQPYSSEQGRYIFDLARIDAARAPAYSRTDLRVDRRFSIGVRNVTTWLEMQNVFDRANAFQYVWSPKTGRLQSIPQIRFLPVVGLEVEL